MGGDKKEEFCRQFFEELLDGREPAYLTTIDLVEYGYQLALKDYRETPQLFGKQAGRQVRSLDGPAGEMVIWQEDV